MSESTVSAPVSQLTDLRYQFQRHKEMAELAMAQVSPNRINWYFHNNTNSLGILVKHISGTLTSRFTDFLRTDGEKVWRHRDVEFVDDIEDHTMLMEVWNRGWNVLFETMDDINDDVLDRIVYVDGDDMTAREAINFEMTHMAYHIGQIVFLSKMLAIEWKAITIPKTFPFLED